MIELELSFFSWTQTYLVSRQSISAYNNQTICMFLCPLKQKKASHESLPFHFALGFTGWSSLWGTQTVESFKETNTCQCLSQPLRAHTWGFSVWLYEGQSHRLWPHPPGSSPVCTCRRCIGSCHWVGHCPPRSPGSLAPPPDNRCPATCFRCLL